MKDRKGNWMQTYSGGQFWPLDPHPEDINIADIAHALARLCRFAGHCTSFYSVAQHSVLVSYITGPENALWGLLHDASEAYVVDVPRPLKLLLPNYTAIEDGVQRAIAEAFGLPWPLPAEVKRADNQILADEAAQLMAPPPEDWFLPDPPSGTAINPLPPEAAETLFLDRFRELAGAGSNG